MKKKVKVTILICCILLILPNILSARNNEWARFSKNMYISSYAFQDSIHWIGTGVGLFKYNSNTDSLQHILKVDNISTEKVNYITVSENGSVWFLVNIEDSITIDLLDLEEINGYINCFTFDNEGNLLIVKVSTTYSSMTGDAFHQRDVVTYKIDGNKLIHLETTPDILKGDYGICQIEIDNNETLWLHNRSSFFKFSDTKLKRIKLWELVMPIHEVGGGRYQDTIYPNYPGHTQDQVINGHGDLVDQQEEGHWTYTNSNNKIMMEGIYEAGRRIGVWKKYYSNGSIYKEIEYENGFRDGYYVDYYRSGSKWNEGTYSKGIKVGEWINWHDNGNVREKTEYEDNIKNGLFTSYHYENGTYGEVEFVNGSGLGEWKYFNPEGKQIYSTKFPTAIKQPDKLNENGKKQGLWVTFLWRNFTKCNSVEDATYYRIAEYDDGVPQGIVRDYFMNGVLQFEGELISEFPSVYDGKIKIYDALGRIKAEREYKNGKMHGIVKTVTNSINAPKRTVEIEYKDGKKDGLTIIREDDEVTNEGHYANGLKSGNWVEIKKDKMYKGEYVKGRRVGPWKTYSDEGLKVIRYNKKGEKIDPINLKEVYPTSLLKVLEYKKVPVIINPVSTDTWPLKLCLSSLMNKIESEKECAPVVSTESTDWPVGKMSTIGRETMYMLQGFIDGKYPPTECSVTDFNPKVKYYKKWWQKYQNDLGKE